MAVLSYQLWQQQFGGTKEVLGARLVMDILPNGPPLVQWRYKLSYCRAGSEPFASTQGGGARPTFVLRGRRRNSVTHWISRVQLPVKLALRFSVNAAMPSL